MYKHMNVSFFCVYITILSGCLPVIEYLHTDNIPVYVLFQYCDGQCNQVCQLALHNCMFKNDRKCHVHIIISLQDADAIEKLNETGDLRQILRRYKVVLTWLTFWLKSSF